MAPPEPALLDSDDGHRENHSSYGASAGNAGIPLSRRFVHGSLPDRSIGCAVTTWLKRNWIPLACVILALIGLGVAAAGIIKPCEPETTQGMVR
jgi:hypothetical protein